MARRYDNRKRLAAAEKTRRRILEAALEVYIEVGFSAASIQAIARKAEVSPGTVLNHFDGGEALMVAAVEVLYQQLEFPTPEVFEGIVDLNERVKRYTQTLAVFYQRTTAWYHIRNRELGSNPTLKRVEAEFYERLNLLTRAALGAGLRDKKTLTIVHALTSPGTFGNLQAMGMSARAAGAAVAEVLVPWLQLRKNKNR